MPVHSQCLVNRSTCKYSLVVESASHNCHAHWVCACSSESSNRVPLTVGTNVGEPKCVVPITTPCSLPPAPPPALPEPMAEQTWQLVGTSAKATPLPLLVDSASPVLAPISAPVRRQSPPRQKQPNHNELRIAEVQEKVKQAQAKAAAKQQQQQKAADDR